MTLQHATQSNPLQVQSSSNAGWLPVQAEATQFNGMVVREDFTGPIARIIRDQTALWNILSKELATTDVVREIQQDTMPRAGFINKLDQQTTSNITPPTYNQLNLSDPGQAIKAMGGRIQMSHYTQSLSAAQGFPYGDQNGGATADLVKSTGLLIERTLFAGNATNNPLEFNGIDAQTPDAHKIVVDATAAVPADQTIYNAIRSTVRRAYSSRAVNRQITHIFATGLALELLEKEVDSDLSYQNLDVVRPGLQVRTIQTQAGSLPLVLTPYISDMVGAEKTVNPGYDAVYFYLLDIDTLIWKGIFPYGGQQTFNPQIFDVTKYSSPDLLAEERYCLCYGTLFARYRGASLWRLEVRVPSGTVDPTADDNPIVGSAAGLGLM